MEARNSMYLRAASFRMLAGCSNCFTSQPLFSFCIQRIGVGTFQSGHIGLDLESESGLQIGEVFVAFGELRQNFWVELHCRRRIDGIHAVLFVEQPSQHDGPAVRALLEEIIKASGAEYVHLNIMYETALRNRHFGLG